MEREQRFSEQKARENFIFRATELVNATGQVNLIGLQERKKSFWPETIFPDPKNDEEEFLKHCYSLLKEAHDNPNSLHDYLRKRAQFFLKLRDQIINRNYYQIIGRGLDLAENNMPNDLTPFQPLLLNEAYLLYQLCGTSFDPFSFKEKVLVGVKSGDFWKELDWSKYRGNRVELEKARHNALNQISYNLLLVGSYEQELVPTHTLSIAEIKKLQIPRPVTPVADNLEDAFYKRRYLIPQTGAEVRFQNAGNLEKMIIKQSGNKVFAKAVVSGSEIFLWVDLNDASIFSPEFSIISRYNPDFLGVSEVYDSRFAEVLAETYHDLVTAIELPITGYRSFTSKDIKIEKEKDKSPRVIYIPRTLRIKKGEDFRPVYEGPRMLQPHRVVGHKRKGNITEEHRQELKKFEEENGISILKWLPDGYTFVRPYVVPANAEIAMKDLPIFIKRRIETRLKIELKE